MNIRPIVFYLFLLNLILTFPCLSQAQTIGDYDVVWRSPSSDASGAMPLGNGELGINLWVEPSGDLLFYLSRTDSWSETGRLLKLGKVRVSLSPNPFAAGSAFTQRLNLQQGTIEITGEQGKERTKLTVFADPGAPVLHLLCTSSRPVNVTATSEPWRTAPYDIPKEDSLLGINSAWPRTGTYDYTQAVESADQPLSDPDAVVWYHRNEHSTYPLTLDLMELHSLASRFDDPLLHRTFGVRMSGAGFVKRSPLEIATVRPVKHFDLRLATCTAQTPDIATWECGKRQEGSRSQSAMVEKFLGQKLHLRRNAGHRHGVPHHTILSAAKLDVGLRRPGSLSDQIQRGYLYGRPGLYRRENQGECRSPQLGRRLLVAEYPADVLPDARLGRF